MTRSRYAATRRPINMVAAMLAHGLLDPTTGVTTVTGYDPNEKPDNGDEKPTETTMHVHHYGEDKLEIPGPRDNRPEWQKIGSRGGRSHPNRRG